VEAPAAVAPLSPREPLLLALRPPCKAPVSPSDDVGSGGAARACAPGAGVGPASGWTDADVFVGVTEVAGGGAGATAGGGVDRSASSRATAVGGAAATGGAGDADGGDAVAVCGPALARGAARAHGAAALVGGADVTGGVAVTGGAASSRTAAAPAPRDAARVSRARPEAGADRPGERCGCGAAGRARLPARRDSERSGASDSISRMSMKSAGSAKSRASHTAAPNAA